MIKLNDHYYIAWLKAVKDIEFKIVDKKIYVDMTPNQYTSTLEEYKNTHKPVLKEIRKVVKILADLTSKAD